MPLKTGVKICGITSQEALSSAIQNSAEWFGLVFYPRSPRFVSDDRAAALASFAEGRIRTVGLFVDPDNETLERVTRSVKLDMIQLHGNEDPHRVSIIRNQFHLPIMKAIRVAAREDLKTLSYFDNVADWLLFDAKVEGQAGGTGVAFDWPLLRNAPIRKSWMLSGGLHTGNVRSALEILNPHAVDVSSGVEDRPGQKSPEKIAKFIRTVREI